MKKIIIILMAFGVLFAGRNDPKDELPDGHINGAELSWVNAYTINVGLTNKVSTLKDSTDRWDMTFTNALTVVLTNSNTAGQLGGLARSITLTSNTLYYVYVLFKTTKPYSNVCYAIVTTNATTPEWIINSITTNIDKLKPAASATNVNTNYIPFSYRQVGSFVTWDTNSTVQAVPFTQSGKGRTRTTMYSSSAVHQGDVAVTTGTNIDYQSVSLLSLIPDTATETLVSFSTTNTMNIISASAQEIGPSAAAGLTVGGTTAVLVNTPVWVPVSSQQFLYRAASVAGTCTMYVSGYKEEL
jgi:hypothetical protein